MYRMIIIDDEEYVLEGLAKFIDWKEIGIEVAATARNGLEGLEHIRVLKPDIVLTDICMPIMDGISMIREIRSDGLDVQVVILTGYGDFEYAREGIKYGVLDYILKPSLPEEIKETMLKVTGFCREKAERSKKELELRKRLMESLPALREKFLEELFEGKIREETRLVQQTGFLGLDLAGKAFAVLTFYIDCYEDFLKQFQEEEGQLIKYSILDIARDTLEGRVLLPGFKERSCHGLLLLERGREIEFPDEGLTGKLQGIVDTCQRLHHVRLSIGAGKPAGSFTGIRESFLQSVECLKYWTFHGNGNVIYYQDIARTELEVPVLRLYDRNRLEDAIKRRSLAAMQECLEEMFEEVKKKTGCIRFDYLKMTLYEMIGSVSLVLYQMGGGGLQDVPFRRIPLEGH